IGIVGERLIDVALEDRDPAGDGALHFRARNLDASRIHALVLRQPLQQFAFAATEIEHTRFRLHDFADDRVVAAAQQFPYEAGLHDSFSNVLARNPPTSSVCSATSTRKESCP